MYSLKTQQLLGIVVGVLVITLYGIFLTQKINLVTADLGRHLKNGEIFLQQWQVVTTNFYSYTYPDFPTLNHHWGAGVLLYLISSVGGLITVQLFFIFVSLTAFALFFRIAAREVGVGMAGLLAIPIIPLLAERTEIRPETISMLFAGLFFLLLHQFQKNEQTWRMLLALPLVMLIWVNVHIYFFLGFAIMGTFLVEFLIGKKWKRFMRLLSVFGIAALATLTNPFGIRGAVAPFTIFQNYGYDLVENKSVLFLEALMHNPNFFIFKLVFFLLIASFIITFVKRPREVPISFFLLAAGFSAMAWFALRNFALFGLFALPLMAKNMAITIPELRTRAGEYTRQKIAAFLLALLILFAISGGIRKIYPLLRLTGIGLEPGNAEAINFFRRTEIRGPIFNNYDIGGYLIYYLFPAERVFVDNRPEAYPMAFFKETYIPIQESEERWHEAEGQYGFNAIIFSYHDATSWSQNFLIHRIQDPSWVPVFVDKRVLILVKNNTENQQIIKQYAIPRDRFGVVTR